MESVAAFFSANPAVATILAVFAVVIILFFILKKFIKLTVVFLFIILLVGGIYFFKDPTATPDKIKNAVETIKTGSQQIADKFSSFWKDTKELAGKAKEVPGDIDNMLDTAKKEVGK